MYADQLSILDYRKDSLHHKEEEMHKKPSEDWVKDMGWISIALFSSHPEIPLSLGHLGSINVTVSCIQLWSIVARHAPSLTPLTVFYLCCRLPNKA